MKSLDHPEHTKVRLPHLPPAKKTFREYEFPVLLPKSPLLVTINPGAIPCRASAISNTGLLFMRRTSTSFTTPVLARTSISLIFAQGPYLYFVHLVITILQHDIHKTIAVYLISFVFLPIKVNTTSMPITSGTTNE